MSDPKLGLVSAGKTRDPPYAADTRNRGWVFTIDLARVRQSDTWSLCAAEFRPWLLWLWIKSWDEIPIGSYPNDDSIIAAKIGMTLELFDGHRSMLMRGWYRANDNRLYHPYISELVLNRILWKEAERVRKAAWREHLSHDVPRDTASVPRDCDGTGSGSGSGSGSKNLKPLNPLVAADAAPRSVPTQKEKNPALRATRLPEDWKIPEDWIAVGLAVHPDWTRAGVLRESLTFRDHWCAKAPGKEATRVNWLLTWRTWIRRADHEPVR